MISIGKHCAVRSTKSMNSGYNHRRWRVPRGFVRSEEPDDERRKPGSSPGSDGSGQRGATQPVENRPQRLARLSDAARFDPIYHGHFKCNWKRGPSSWTIIREPYQWPGSKTFDLQKTQGGPTQPAQRNVNQLASCRWADMSHLRSADDRGRSGRRGQGSLPQRS